jgi:GTPase
MKSGYVTIVGRPNVGKSTLLNSIMERKIAITSDVRGTTRNLIEGIYTKDDIQIIFVDTPGIHKPQNKLGRILNEQAYVMLDNVDLVLFVVDVTQKFGTGDKFILDKLKENNSKVILILNKIDKIKYEELLPLINEYKNLYNFEEIIPLSATKNKNIDDLIKTISKYLTDNIAYYDEDTVTNVSVNFEVGELIREKILNLTKDEIPHSVTVLVNSIEEDKNNISISADIIVDRESVKKIIVGKNGQMIKEIGIKSRVDIEELLDKKVYLDLFVKVVPNWKEKDRFLNQIGYEDFNKNI